jgi:hypothetical protein
VIPKISPEVFFKNGLQCGCHVMPAEDVFDPGNFRMPLTKYLISETTLSQLVFNLAVFFGPVGLHERIRENAGLALLVKGNQHRTISQIYLLNIVTAVEQLTIDIIAPLSRQILTLYGELMVAHRCGHD